MEGSDYFEDEGVLHGCISTTAGPAVDKYWLPLRKSKPHAVKPCHRCMPSSRLMNMMITMIKMTHVASLCGLAAHLYRLAQGWVPASRLRQRQR